MPHNPEQNKRALENFALNAHEPKSALLSKLKQMFPDVKQDNNLQEYLSGSLHHASIESNAPEHMLRAFISTALTRATDTQRPTFSLHGANKHPEIFPEAIDTIVSYVRSGEYSIRKETYGTVTDIRLGKRQMERFIVETPRFSRETYLPGPLAAAMKMQGNDRKIAQGLAIDTQLGYGYALLYLIYKQHDAHSIRAILSDKRWLNENLKNLRGTILRNGNDQTIYMIERARARLIIPSAKGDKINPDPEKYKDTLELLNSLGFDVPKPEQLLTAHNGRAFQFDSFSQLVQPMAVLSGEVEQAELLATNEFRDPARFQTTHSFENHITSKVVTAYLKVLS